MTTRSRLAALALVLCGIHCSVGRPGRLLGELPVSEPLVSKQDGSKSLSFSNSVLNPATWLTSTQTYVGDGTAFSEALNGSGSGFACAYHYVNPLFSKMFAAMNIHQWQDGNVCGRCVTARCIDPKCPIQNASVTVQILDLCPECKYGDVDFSYPAYSAVTGSWPNRLKVEWEWTSCAPDINGTIQYTPKDGINHFWQAFYLSNSRYPLSKVVFNGQTLSRSPFNFYIHGGLMPNGPVALQLTADSGATINATIADVTKAQDLKVQFPATM